ncbi:hypothetical protein O6H91_15G047600 [Diphasiastrum complanatum]|uniref:Uncharacterized protein n=1 Tax=Diphasiastrum complanatum TaxID=34168 RepID=A0ACC2BHY2_DIPCM|nr:hypothetical protein O6H91_15G047600 [Diphasiastrum complanatum]
MMSWRVRLTILVTAFCSTMSLALADRVAGAGTSFAASILVDGSTAPENENKATGIPDSLTKQTSEHEKPEIQLDEEVDETYCNSGGEKMQINCEEARSLVVVIDYSNPAPNPEPPSRAAPKGGLPKTPSGKH